MYGLSPEDQIAYRVATAIKNGTAFLEATAANGVTWSEKEFGRRIAQMMTNPAYRAGLSQAARTVLSQAVRTVGGAAVTTAESILAAAGASLAMILGTILVVGGLGAGVWMAVNWGKPESAPVAAGTAMQGSHTRNVGERSAAAPISTAPYGVYVGGGYNEVIVGQLPVILDEPTGNLVGWGTDRTKKVKDSGASFKMVLGPFKTAAEARKAYDETKIAGSERVKPLAAGTAARFKFDGQEHDIDNATRFLR